MKRRWYKMTADVVEDMLPIEPPGFSYRVEQFSKLVYRVMLINHASFTYKDEDEEIATVWGFVKSTGAVHRPKSRDRMSSIEVCKVTNIPQELCYTTIIPEGPRSLHHLS